jgi:uncharacterized membrane protein HdeD (DUF308 family)
MIQLLVKNWWALEVRGALTIVFGLLALLLPNMTLGALVLLFGTYALTEGTVLLFMSFQWRRASHWWMTLLQGVAGAVAGIGAFVWPEISAVNILFIIVAWASATGILELAGALVLRKEPKGEWLLVLSGLVSLFFAYMLLANPAVGALVLLSVIGIYAVIFGILQISLGSRVHHVVRI